MFRVSCRCGRHLIVVHCDAYGVIIFVCMRWPGFWNVGVLLFVVYLFSGCILRFGCLFSYWYLSSVGVYCSVDAVCVVRDSDFTY